MFMGLPLIQVIPKALDPLQRVGGTPILWQGVVTMRNQGTIPLYARSASGAVFAVGSAPGEGVPAAGDTDEVLTKATPANYDTKWASVPRAVGDLSDVDTQTAPPDMAGQTFQFDGLSQWKPGIIPAAYDHTHAYLGTANGHYLWSVALTGDPGPGHASSDTTSLLSTTVLRISSTDKDGVQRDTWWDRIGLGDTIQVVPTATSTQILIATVRLLPTIQGGGSWIDIPVTPDPISTISNPLAEQEVLITWSPASGSSASMRLDDLVDVAMPSPADGVSPTWNQAQAAYIAGGPYVPRARRVATGTGLTGGGDLSADRTLALDTGYTDGRYQTSAVPGWTNCTLAGGVSGTAQARVDRGVVQVKANVSTSGSGLIFTLPGGMKPAWWFAFRARGAGTTVVDLFVNNDGTTATASDPGGTCFAAFSFAL
jgi:hypothetical protein